MARDLLGKILVHESPEGLTSGKIVEVEAYDGTIDKASHAYKNLRTGRTEIQFGQSGYAYVYLIYGIHICFNVVTEEIGKPGAVLVRALDPIDGIDLMYSRRKFQVKSQKTKFELANGPGKLCAAMGITKALYGNDLVNGPLYIIENNTGQDDFDVAITPRIGVDYAEEDKDLLWRFIIAGSPYISMKKFTEEYLTLHFRS